MVTPEFHAALEGFGDLRRLRREIAAWLEGHALPREVVDDLLLAVNEVATNAIEASPTDRATVTAQAAAGRVELSVGNDGRPFAGEVGPDTGVVLSERGRGLHITRALVDRLSFARVDGCTEATLVKLW